MRDGASDSATMEYRQPVGGVEMKHDNKNYILKADYTVFDADKLLSVAMIEQFHYSRSAPRMAAYRHGLYRKDNKDVLLGVAWWCPTTREASIATFPEGDWKRVMALSRLVILPHVPTNAASMLMSRSIKLIKQDGRFDCLVTYADTFKEHTGSIYRATNWEYMGVTKPTGVWTCHTTGRIVARKSSKKSYTVTEMRDGGHVMQGKYCKHKYRMVLRIPEVEHSIVANPWEGWK